MEINQLKYKNISKTIIKRYIPAVILILVLIIMKQLIVQYQINQDENLSKVVNISGRQRMLSQRISKDAYALYLTEDKVKIDFYINELKMSADLWKRSSSDLKNGNPSDTITKLFSEIEENHTAMLNASYDIITMIESEDYSKSILIDKLNIIENNEKIFLKGMDTIVYQYDQEFQDKMVLLGKTEMILFWVTVVIILFEILYIFIPAGKSLSTAFEEIRESNENMLKLFKTAHGAMFVLDQKNLQVLIMNKEAEELGDIDSFLGRSISFEDIIKCEYNDYFALIQKIKNNEKNENIELIINTNKKKNIAVLLSSTKMHFHKKDAILVGIFDITLQKKAEEVLKNIAITDELTGAYNRYFLEERINEEIKHADVYNEPLSIIILDLDHFKKINDTWGHPVGDEILKQTAEIASSIIRRSDVLFRLGGEEFLVLMPKTTIDEAFVVAERLRETLENNPNSVVGKITASFGVAQKIKFESFNSLYKRADEALYKAKGNGRNRVVSYLNQEHSSIALVHFEWNSEWESGDKELDKQHREILEIGNNLIFMLLSGEKIEKTMNQLDILLKHVIKHFDYEERIIKETGYEDYDEHSKTHRNLVEKLFQLRKSYQTGELKSSEFFSFIVDDVVVGHVLHSDLEFFPYIQNKDIQS